MKQFLILAAVAALSLSTFAQSNTPPDTTLPAPTPPLRAVPLADNTWPTAQFTAASAKDPSVAKAKKILDEMIKALGGEAYLNVRDMSTEGRSYAFYQGKPSGLGVLFWRFWQWPDKDRMELTKQRDIVELWVGDKGYEITYKGTTTQDAKQLDNYLRRRAHSLANVVRNWLSAQGSLILYSGTAIVERNMTDEVTIFNSENDSVTISVDPFSHLPTKLAFSYRDPLDRMKDDEAEIFGNYRLVQGINTPYSTVRTQNGEMRSQHFITNVTYNTGLAPTLFEVKGITYNPPKTSPPQ